MRLFCFLFIVACQEESSTVQISRSSDETVLRDWNNGESHMNLAWFARASIDIRGHRPSESELEWAQNNPEILHEILDGWLNEDAFAHQMAWYWNDVLHTAVWIGQLSRFQRFELTNDEKRALGWEPLSYIEQSISTGEPFTSIVTTGKVPTNPALSMIFGDDIESSGWEMYTPERGHPEAGLIASRVLWIRHFVDFLNHNRTRANYYSSTFLCQDFLERDVAFDFSQISLDNVETAIQTQPECVTCHASLDPLASVFGPFQDGVNLDIGQMGVASEFKQRWFAGWKDPSYFGLPLNNLSELGQYTAADARFSQCMVERTWDFLVEEAPLPDLDRFSLTNQFVAADYSMSSLVKLIVQTPEYVQQQQRIIRPEQLLQTILEMSSVEEGGAEYGIGQLVWSPEHRVLFGSTDDVEVLTSNPSFTVGHHLALQWLTEELSNSINSDLGLPLEDRVLLTLMEDNSEISVKRQMASWKRSLHSEWVDYSDSEVQRLFDLWTNVHNQNGEMAAWSTIMAVLLHDPKAVLR